MMTGTSYIYKIYQHPLILEYLRFNPKWYKILDEKPELINEFLTEARTAKKIRTIDKLENIKDQIDFFKQIANLL